jgi:hypothetical protein
MTLFATASELLAHRRVRAALLLTLPIAVLLLLAPLAIAQSPIVRIARISLLDGEVSYQRAGDSNKDWTDATLNMPLDERDQLYSGPTGRVEIQMSGRNLVRIDRNTNLRFSQFNTGTIQFALPVGTATFRVDSLDRRQFNVVDANDAGKDDPVYFEVDTPIVAVTFMKEGNYRLNVRDDGTTEVIVRRGQAEVYSQEIGSITVKQGRRIVIDGRDVNYFQIARLEDKDNWDRWNDRRDDELFARMDTSQSARYIPAAVPGVYDLDNYGDWISTPDYGYVWYPRAMPVGWAPYRAGYWRYYGGWGWTWISYEPWGWVPYHYGRWAWYSSRWCWVPTVSVGWGWSPHQVVFYGWGGGSYNRGYRDGYRDGRYGWYGWTPLGPRDRHYGYGSTTVVNNVTVINNVRSLSNYDAPGGVSLMESRRFDQGRVIVTQNEVKGQNEIKLPPAPPRGSAQRDNEGEPRVLRGDEFKPTQAVPTRELKPERAELARRIESPVVERRPSPRVDGLPGADRLNPSVRGAAGESIGTRPNRDGQAHGPTPERGVPSRGSDVSSPTRVQDGQIIRTDRPSRSTDYQPVERIPVPTRRASDENRSPVDRSSPSREAGDSPRSMPTPSRSTDRPSRSESPSRADPPSRSESPRRYDPPPTRESAPQRSERPSSPPRESAPQRTERPPDRPSSPPPARESAPARSESRSERPAPPSREKP